jgi:hypothetical protein
VSNLEAAMGASALSNDKENSDPHFTSSQYGKITAVNFCYGGSVVIRRVYGDIESKMQVVW